MSGLKSSEFKRRTRLAFAHWKANRRIFRVSDGATFKAILDALDHQGLLRSPKPPP